MEFSTYVQSVTNNRLVPKVKDTILKSNVATLLFLGNSKKWSGRKLEMAVKTAASTTGGSFSGLDTMATNLPNNLAKLSFDSRGFYWTVPLAGLDVDITKADPGAAVDLAKMAMQSAAEDMSDAIGTVIYGDGTGNGSKDFLGLKAIADDGTYAPTYGGLTRSSYDSLDSNVYTPAGNLSSFSTIATAMSAAQAGTEEISFIVTGAAKFNEAEALIQATQVTNVDGVARGKYTRHGYVPAKDANKGEAGFQSIFYRGAAIVLDQKCPALYMYGVNEKYIGFYSVPVTLPGYTNVKVGGGNEIEGVYSDEPGKNLSFGWSGWEFTPNQYGVVGKFILHGNLVSGNPNRHFRIIFGA